MAPYIRSHTAPCSCMLHEKGVLSAVI